MRVLISLIVLSAFVVSVQADLVAHTPGSGWQQFAFSGSIAGSQGFRPDDFERSDDSYAFTITVPATISLADVGWNYEGFDVYNFGSYTGFRIPFAVPTRPNNTGYDFDSANKSGTWNIDPGNYELHFRLGGWWPFPDELLGSSGRILGGFRVDPIPEPSTILVMGTLGVVPMVCRRRIAA